MREVVVVAELIHLFDSATVDLIRRDVRLVRVIQGDPWMLMEVCAIHLHDFGVIILWAKFRARHIFYFGRVWPHWNAVVAIVNYEYGWQAGL